MEKKNEEDETHKQISYALLLIEFPFTMNIKVFLKSIKTIY